VSVETLQIRAGSGSYDVLVGRGLLGSVGSLARPLTQAKRCAIVTDDVVGELYGDALLGSLMDAGFDPTVCRFAAGESSKSWREAGVLLERLSGSGLGRDSVVFALGGGVVGDLGGFAAAVYLRGVPVVHVPTTLLAQVDSSIGGKTAVDLPMGKNLAGAFWAPLAVFADLDCLGSLPATEWASGMGEAAKSALLDGEGSVAALEADAAALAAREATAVDRTVLMAAGLKARVVSGDEREAGPREALNLGHTLGHAIERVAGYGTVAHGRAVAEGIRFAAMVAEDVLDVSPAYGQRQDRLLTAVGLPPGRRTYEPAALLQAMYADKKVRAGEVRMVLSKAPGSWEIRAVREDVLAHTLERWVYAPDTKGQTT
jgi:3-dehydroquinate synthase